jgi:hypothetical protein
MCTQAAGIAAVKHQSCCAYILNLRTSCCYVPHAACMTKRSGTFYYTLFITQSKKRNQIPTIPQPHAFRWFMHGYNMSAHSGNHTVPHAHTAYNLLILKAPAIFFAFHLNMPWNSVRVMTSLWHKKMIFTSSRLTLLRCPPAHAKQ